MAPAEDSNQVKAAVTEEVAVHEDKFQTQQRSPITILSEDEGYLLEEDQPITKTEVKAEAGKEFSTLGNKAVRPSRKKNKLEVMEFASVKHQGRTVKMLGELAPG